MALPLLHVVRGFLDEGGRQWEVHGEIEGSIPRDGALRRYGWRRIPATESGVSDPPTGIVIGYVAAVATLVGMLLILLRNGW
jgi:hypothetical protein